MTTTNNSQRIAKNTVFLYFRMLLTMAISLYTSRVVLGVLGVEDYGIYSVVGGFVSMFAMMNSAMTAATQRNLSYELGRKGDGELAIVFSNAIIIHLALGLFVLILLETFGLWFLNHKMVFAPDRYYAANWVFQFSVLTFIVNIISVPYNAALIAFERMKAFAYIGIIEVSLKLVVVYLLVVSSWDKLIVYSVLLALISVLIRFIYGKYVNRNLLSCRCNWKFSKYHAFNMLSFAGWNLFGSFAGVLKEQGINIILNLFFGTVVNAARGITHQVLVAVTSFVSNFQLAMNPHIVKQYAKGEVTDMYKLVFTGSKLSFYLVAFISMPLIVRTDYVLDIWLKNVPEHTVIFMRLVLLTALIDSFSQTLSTVMLASGKLKDYQIVVSIVLILSLPVSYVLLKNGCRPESALLVVLVFSFLGHIARLVMLGKSINFPWVRFLKEVTFVSIVVLVISFIFPISLNRYIPYSATGFVLESLVCVVSCLFVAYTIGLTKPERNSINKIIKSKIK